MSSKLARAVLFFALGVVGAILPPTTRGADLFVAVGYPGNIAEYSPSGALENDSVAQIGAGGPNSLALAGNDLFTTSGNTVSEYDTSGNLISASLIPGLLGPTALTVSGGDLFVVSSDGTVVGEYTTSGQVVNAWLITSTGGEYALAVYDGNLFVANGASVAEYTMSGTLVNADFVTDSTGSPNGLLFSDGHLFVSNFGNEVSNGAGDGSVSEYDAATGALINAGFITGLTQPNAMVAYGGDLYVVNYTSPNGGFIGEYDASTGATINASLISGTYFATGIVVTPEPASWVMLVIGAVGLWAFRRRRRLGT